MNYLPKLTFLVVCLLLLAGTAMGMDRQAVVTPVSGDALPVGPGLSPSGADGVCGVGNPNPLAFALTDWVWGAERYKYMFYADPAQCTACTEGFTVESVGLVLQFGVEDVPSTFDCRVDFEEAL